MNLPYSSTAKTADGERQIAGHSAPPAANAPGVVLREMAAAMGAALGFAAGINLLLLWLGMGPA
ncbi:MAG TPA: hypothetical protein VLC74_10550 [Rhizomicrobium sp.]|nr:hypothetical protein [Rhizomicrobium sp.]